MKTCIPSPALLLALPLLALAACGTDDEAAGGALQITAQLEPSPPVVGPNTLHIDVRDGAGDPVEGATITVEPFMPGHGHGSSEEPVVTEHGSGHYQAAPVTFTMPGAWEITVEARAAGETGRLVLDQEVGGN